MVIYNYKQNNNNQQNIGFRFTLNYCHRLWYYLGLMFKLNNWEQYWLLFLYGT